jgi:hypothetical protein
VFGKSFTLGNLNWSNHQSVAVFIIRFAERRIDQLFDATLLDYVPLTSEFEAVQFQSGRFYAPSLENAKFRIP